MHPFSLQVVIDCTSPHELADWWAETLGWQVEPQDESFIRKMIAKGFASEDETTVHCGALVWKSATAVRPVEPTGAAQPRLLFQHVPETKSVKNRVHLDLRPDRTGEDGFDSAAYRQWLLDRGATVVGGGQQGSHRWVTMSDPEGNEFCIDE